MNYQSELTFTPNLKSIKSIDMAVKTLSLINKIYRVTVNGLKAVSTCNSQNVIGATKKSKKCVCGYTHL